MNIRTIGTLKRYFGWKDRSKLERAYHAGDRGARLYKILLDRLVIELSDPVKYPVFDIHNLLNELPKGFIENVMILAKHNELDMFIDFIKRALGENDK